MCTPNFVIKYLSKIETEYKNTLSRLSGAQMGSNHEKDGVRKFDQSGIFLTDVIEANRFFKISSDF